jgi:hypothetical protein
MRVFPVFLVYREHGQHESVTAAVQRQMLVGSVLTSWLLGSNSARFTGKPDILAKLPACRQTAPNHSLPALDSKGPYGEEPADKEHCFPGRRETVLFCGTKPRLQLREVR